MLQILVLIGVVYLALRWEDSPDVTMSEFWVTAVLLLAALSVIIITGGAGWRN